MNQITSQMVQVRERGNLEKLCVEMVNCKFLYLLLLPAVLLTIFFNYLPIGGIKMAFQNYNIMNPDKSEWVWFENFKELFHDPDTARAIMNTFYVSILSLIVSFPVTISFALLLNELKNGWFKKSVQTISYLPHFLSWISVIGIAASFYARDGFVNDIIVKMTGNPNRTLFLAEQAFFVPNLIILSIWKELGWGAVIYLAAITGIDPALYEASVIDGAGPFKRIWYVTLPSIMPTVVIMLIWTIGGLFASNFELIYGLQNVFIKFDVMQTLIYKRGIIGGDYSATTAFGLFQGVINCALILLANYFAKKATDVALF